MPRAEVIRRQLPEKYRPEFVRARPDVLEQLTARSLANPTPLYSAVRQAMAIQRFNTYGRLGQIVAPTLVVSGSDDILVPPANAYLLADRIPDAALEIFPDAGHGFFWEQPDVLVDLLSEFCYGGWVNRLREPVIC
jgi:pimeloyl-ACP methyl ester carboxylesterase